MPTLFDGSYVKEDFEQAFGFPIEEISIRQLWFLVKFSKHIRLRCRNNSAFNNYMSRNFPSANFGTITKFKRDGTPYQGLQITVNGETLENGDSEE